MFKFDNHYTASDWARENASGPVCVIDAWTYGRIVCFFQDANGRDAFSWSTNCGATSATWSYGTDRAMVSKPKITSEYMPDAYLCACDVVRLMKEILADKERAADPIRAFISAASRDTGWKYEELIADVYAGVGESEGE